MILNAKSCFFTGHRNFKMTKSNMTAVYSTMERLIKSGVTDFYAGGAVGWDMYCENLILILRRSYPQVKLHLVLPCPPEQQTMKFSADDRNKYYIILDAADSTEIVSDHYHSDCMKQRNARLVELGDICLCYYDEANSSRSGTGQTVRMAQKKGAEMINLFKPE